MNIILNLNLVLIFNQLNGIFFDFFVIKDYPIFRKCLCNGSYIRF